MSKQGGFLNIVTGNFNMETGETGKLYVYNKPPYIRIRLKDSKLLFINFKERNKTVEFYTELIKLN